MPSILLFRIVRFVCEFSYTHLLDLVLDIQGCCVTVMLDGFIRAVRAVYDFFQRLARSIARFGAAARQMSLCARIVAPIQAPAGEQIDSSSIRYDSK